MPTHPFLDLNRWMCFSRKDTDKTLHLLCPAGYENLADILVYLSSASFSTLSFMCAPTALESLWKAEVQRAEQSNAFHGFSDGTMREARSLDSRGWCMAESWGGRNRNLTLNLWRTPLSGRTLPRRLTVGHHSASGQGCCLETRFCEPTIPEGRLSVHAACNLSTHPGEGAQMHSFPWNPNKANSKLILWAHVART